ncbi:MAG: hypothetical protein GX633_03115 [Clostridiales bacterium]|nr:hypothetical protein [Clostridiales bacterium]
MKVCIIQPEYSTDYSRCDELFLKQLALLESCDESVDLIVLPESADEPCYSKTRELFELSVRKYNPPLLKACREAAKRCNAVVFFNGSFEFDSSFRNTTYAIDRSGEVVGMYFKQHLTPGEISVMKLDHEYTYEHGEPTVITIDGIRYGFLTCYDFYYYETFANMARYNLDIIIGCSHQRTDTHSALETMCQFCAYNCNSYVVRSSVSMGSDSPVGGGSMVVAPNGTVLVNMKSSVGTAYAEFDAAKKYYKPAGFGNPDSAHHEYTEKGRRPWKYRNGGSAIVRHDAIMPYPRVCAHRGFSTLAPENSMPAFGAAVALGAVEIEFDLWYTKDGEIVSIHDDRLDRVSDGEGFVYEHTYEELTKFDFGVKHSENLKGLRIVRFEDILKKFAGHTIMNIHIKTLTNDCEYDESLLQKIVDLIHKYDCEKYVYFMSGNDNLLRLAKRIAPHITLCCGAGDNPWEIVERAIELKCQKVQLFKPYFNQEMIDKAHEHNVICNVFWSNDPEEAKQFINMGIDTILSDDYYAVAQAVESIKVR